MNKEKVYLDDEGIKKEVLLAIESSGIEPPETNPWYQFCSKVEMFLTLFFNNLLDFIFKYFKKYPKTICVLILSLLVLKITYNYYDGSKEFVTENDNISIFVLLGFITLFMIWICTTPSFMNILSFLQASLTTFIIVYGFALSLSLTTKYLMIRLKIIDLQDLQKTNPLIIIIAIFLSLIFIIKPASLMIISYLQGYHIKWKFYKITTFSFVAFLCVFINISILIWIEYFNFDHIFSNEADKISNIYNVKEYFTAHISLILLLSFALHSLGLLISQYYVDKKYNEVYNNILLKNQDKAL